ncbi:MAG: hypothetical protein WCK39_03185 [Methanomassiliicoccales archaeon]
MSNRDPIAKICWKRNGLVRREFELTSGGKILASLKSKSILASQWEGEFAGRTISITAGVSRAEINEESTNKSLGHINKLTTNFPKSVFIETNSRNESVGMSLKLTEFRIESRIERSASRLVFLDIEGRRIAGLQEGASRGCYFEFELEEHRPEDPPPGLIAIILLLLAIFRAIPS